MRIEGSFGILIAECCERGGCVIAEGGSGDLLCKIDPGDWYPGQEVDAAVEMFEAIEEEAASMDEMLHDWGAVQCRIADMIDDAFLEYEEEEAA